MKDMIIAVLVIVMASCTTGHKSGITEKELKETVYYLASDSLKGRKAGEAGDLASARYIRSELEKAGLDMLFDDGIQPFQVVTSAKPGEGNIFRVDELSFELGKDFLPYAFSSETQAEAPVVFAGYGMEISKDTLKWNDFEGLDVSGKWILALQGDPDMDNYQSPFAEFSTERAKALAASDRGAAGLLLVAGAGLNEKDQLSPMFFDKNSSRYDIPVIQITRAVAGKILKKTGETVETLESVIKKEHKSVGFPVDCVVSASISVELVETTTQNVVALLPGKDPELKDEYLVVGAHFDHLGMGGAGSGSRKEDTTAVHNGADDNASGVAAVLELAEKAAAQDNFRRSILFVAFGAEEMGLIGSKAFVANSPVPVENIKAMFNFDMLGRLDTANMTLSIGGTKTALESESILHKLNNGFELALTGEGNGPSDHASFYMQDVPVFFISTGTHPDYHTPEDDPERINYEGIREVTEYIHKVLEEVANRDSSLTFREAGAKVQRRGGRFKVTLGIMPDYAGMDKRGLRIDAVSKDRPAEKGGMKRGDVITAINGKKVGNIYDYMNRLQTLEAGTSISVDIIRDSTEMVLIIGL